MLDSVTTLLVLGLGITSRLTDRIRACCAAYFCLRPDCRLVLRALGKTSVVAVSFFLGWLSYISIYYCLGPQREGG